MKDWMRVLADHYQQTRESHPRDQLLILFDIDGTVLDMREMILHLLKAYDRAHETHHAIDLKREDIQVHENDITPLLNRMPLLPEEKESNLEVYKINGEKIKVGEAKKDLQNCDCAAACLPLTSFLGSADMSWSSEGGWAWSTIYEDEHDHPWRRLDDISGRLLSVDGLSDI